MYTLPVLATVGRTLWFQLSNLFTLFRLSWLPLALLVAAQVGLGQLLIWRMGDVPFIGGDGFLGFMALIFATLLLQGIALSVVAVQVHRVILFGERRPGEYFSYPFGGTEFRYIIMGLLTGLMIALPFAVLSYAYYTMRMSAADRAGAAALAIAAQTSPGNPLVSFGVMVAAFLLAVWLILRLSVWPPSVVANNRLWPGEAWRLSRGNVIRLFFLLVLSTIVLVLLVIVVAFVDELVLPGGLAEISPRDPKNPTLRDMVENGAVPAAAPNDILLEFVFQFVTVTYAVAVLSFAYKALRGVDASVPIDVQAESADEASPVEKPMGAL